MRDAYAEDDAGSLSISAAYIPTFSPFKSHAYHPSAVKMCYQKIFIARLISLFEQEEAEPSSIWKELLSTNKRFVKVLKQRTKIS